MHDDVGIMTDIEVLLSVDAGRVPAGAVAFFMRDADAEKRKMRALMAAVLVAMAIGSGLADGGRACVALLMLAAGIFGVLAMPPSSDERPREIKRRVVVVTENGIIMRDGRGLRTWLFADLQAASSMRQADRVDLWLERRDGSKSFINCRVFQRGEYLPDVVKQRLNTQTV
jgi:hypothetical protein